MTGAPDPVVAQLRAKREGLGLSLTKAAARCGMPATVLGSYERGDRQPSLRRIRQWGAPFGLQLVLLPTDAHDIGSSRLQYGVSLGGRVIVERCKDQDEAEATAAQIPGARLATQVVHVGDWVVA